MEEEKVREDYEGEVMKEIIDENYKEIYEEET